MKLTANRFVYDREKVTDHTDDAGTATPTWERLLEELRAEFMLRQGELSLLHNIDLRILDTSQDLSQTLDFIARETRSLISADHVEILMRRGANLVTAQSSPQAPEEDFSYRESVLRTCVTEQDLLLFRDLRTTPATGYVPRNTGPGVPFSSLIAAPIGNRATGVLLAVASRPAAFSAMHGEVAEAIASQIAIAFEQSELFDRASLVNSVDHLIFSHDDPDEIVQAALNAVFAELLRLQYTDVAAAQILFLNEEFSALEVVHSTSPDDVNLTVSIDDSVSGRALREMRTVIVDDVAADPQYKRMLGREIRSEMAIPIVVGPDKLAIGVLNVESADADVFHGAYQLVLERFAQQVATLLAFAKLRSDVANALELRHANELLVAIGDQTSNMVHKLNNTVGAMRVIIKEIEHRCGAELEANAFLKTQLGELTSAAEATLEMPRKVQRFLAQASDRSEVDVNECIEEAIADLEIPDQVVVERSLGQAIPRVSCYSLDLVLDNLMRNAVDAMAEGGTLTVTSALVAYEGVSSGKVEITVADTGVGMSEQTRQKLFDIDFTTKPRRDGKGLGLGLWWVKHWVRRSQGEISVDTDEGSGSRLTVRLPVVVPEQTRSTE